MAVLPDFSLLRPSSLYKYGAGDADATRRLFFIFSKKLKQENLFKYLASPIMEVSKNLILSEIHGVKVDPVKLKQISEVVKESRDYYLVKMRMLILNPSFNPRSVPSLREILYGFYKLEWLVATDKGLSSTSVEAVEEVKRLNPKNRRGLEFIEILIFYRKLEKLLTSYLNKIPKHCDGGNYVHPRFLVGGTVTGRITSKDPALTTLPKDTVYKLSSGEKLISLKSMFIPSKGCVWVHVDYSQIELVMSAFLSGDSVMVGAYRGGIDLHDLTMRKIFQDDYVSTEEAESDPVKETERAIQRRDAKIVNFSIIYGGDPYNTAKSLGYPVERVREIMDQMFSTYSGLKRYLDGIPKLVDTQGYLRTPFGRIRHFSKFKYGGDEKSQHHRDRQAVNTLPQSSGAELTFRSYNRISRRFRNLNMRSISHNIVYDALDFDVPNVELDIASKIIIEEMGRPCPEFEDFSFPFEMGVGCNWSEAEANVRKVKI